MLSNSRIYIFGTQYKGENWFSILKANELTGLMANKLNAAIPELKFKNIQVINHYVNGSFNSEIHINKLKYNELRVIPKKEVKKLQRRIVEQLRTINDFSYNVIDVVNDEFTRQPSTGFLTKDAFYA